LGQGFDPLRLARQSLIQDSDQDDQDVGKGLTAVLDVVVFFPAS
jgi:hypothetical protein